MRSPPNRLTLSRGACLGALLIGSLPVAAQETALRSAESPLLRSALSGEQVSSYASGLLVVFAFLVILAWAARWLQTRGTIGRSGMRVTASVGLGGKERLVIVEVEGQRMLMGVSPGGVTLLRALDGDAPPKAQWLESTLAGTRTREVAP